MEDKKLYIIKVKCSELNSTATLEANDIKECLSTYLTYTGTQIGAEGVIDKINNYLKDLNIKNIQKKCASDKDIKDVCNILDTLKPKMAQATTVHEKLVLYRIMMDYIMSYVASLSKHKTIDFIKNLLNELVLADKIEFKIEDVTN